MLYKNKPHFVVQLVGGLGNQLFGYFAGRALAVHSGTTVKFDLSQLDKGFTAHGSTITDLIPLDFVENKSHAKKIIRKIAGVAESATIGSGRLQAVLQGLLGIYTSREVGFDSQLLLQKPRKLIRGYFQTYQYVQLAEDEIASLALRSPSDWFLRMEAKAILEKPLMVHVRRGDYLKLKMEFGLLSREYFIDAINALLEKLPDSSAPIWVFSDDLSQVRSEWEGHSSHKLVFVDVPANTSDAESLVLMSRGVGNVISNSTFSWWSAMLSPQVPTVAPSKWFRGKPDPIGLIPESWIRLESKWKD